MTEIAQLASAADVSTKVESRLKARHARERRFRAYGLGAILVALAFLALLLTTIISRGAPAFLQTGVTLEVAFDPAVLAPEGKTDAASLGQADYAMLLRNSLQAALPNSSERSARRELGQLLSSDAALMVRKMVLADPSLLGTTRKVWLPVSAPFDQLVKGHLTAQAAGGGQISERQVAWATLLQERGLVSAHFNMVLLTAGDSRQPEQAGLGGALVGSLFTLLVTLLLSFPLGVATAIYLEEFAAKNRWTDLIEININNLAAVPSIVFGLLGLEVFLNWFGLPRSAPLVGGLTLTLLTLPTIIIAARISLKAVPPWIREAALGMGASKLQMVTHHVLPLAMPGILTGTIIGMARAIGETAPLLMIGMVAFIVDVPRSPFDPASALPVQIYLWAASPERAFVERTSAAIMVLLVFLGLMNAGAIYMRKKFERRW